MNEPIDTLFVNEQLSTASKQDTVQKLRHFFGEPAEPQKLELYMNQHALSPYLPDAYNGASIKLRDTINHLVLNQPSTALTSIILPFKHMEGALNFQWDEIKFDQRLLQRVPYEGTSRMIGYTTKRHSDRMVRRGIALMLESDFYHTPQGRIHFSNQLQSVKACVQETCNHDVLYVLLTQNFYKIKYTIRDNLGPVRNIVQAMQREVSNYAIVQKDDYGLDRAVVNAITLMARERVRPNALLIPHELLAYVTMVPEAKIQYDKGGPQAIDRFNGGPDAFAQTTFRNTKVYAVDTVSRGGDAQPFQMLERRSMVGEYYTAKAPPHFDNDRPLPNSYMDVLIFDEEADKLKQISFRKMVQFALPEVAATKNPFNRNDDITGRNPLKIKGAYTKYKLLIDQSLAKLPADSKFKQKEFSIENFYRTFNYSNEQFMEIVEMAEAGIWVPLCVTLVRPFIEHTMLSAIITVAGQETGVTAWGASDMQISANTAVKTIEGHYTTHVKALVSKSDNVLVLEDLMASGYIAGGDVRFFGEVETPMGQASYPSSESIKNEMRYRLNNEREYTNRYGSMLAFLTPYDYEINNNVFSLVGNSGLPWDIGNGTSSGGDTEMNFPGGKAVWEVYNQTLSLASVHAGENPLERQNQDFLRSARYSNSVVFQGPHRVYQPYSNDFFGLIQGKGHWGPDALPGDGRVRRGEAITFENARSQLTGVELAHKSKLPINGRG